MDDWKKRLFPEKFVKDEAEFQAKMDAIEAKYEFWFSKRKDFTTGQSDRLGNYYRIYFDGSSHNLTIEDELPIEIRKECIQAYDEVYNKA